MSEKAGTEVARNVEDLNIHDIKAQLANTSRVYITLLKTRYVLENRLITREGFKKI